MKAVGILLVAAGTIALYVTFPVLLVFSAIGWGIGLVVTAKR